MATTTLITTDRTGFGSRDRWEVSGARPQDVPSILIMAIDRALGPIQAKGDMLEFDVVTDGRPGKPPSQVRPGGNISLVDRSALNLRLALQEAWDLIVRLSPYAIKSPYDVARGAPWTSHYADSHQLLVNGVQFTQEQILGYDPRVDDRIVFLNTQPYGRRFEQGWSMQAPNGVYKVVARRLKLKYGRTIEVYYTERVGMYGNSRGRFPTIMITGRGGNTYVSRGRFRSWADRSVRSRF